MRCDFLRISEQIGSDGGEETGYLATFVLLNVSLLHAPIDMPAQRRSTNNPSPYPLCPPSSSPAPPRNRCPHSDWCFCTASGIRSCCWCRRHFHRQPSRGALFCSAFVNFNFPCAVVVVAYQAQIGFSGGWDGKADRICSRILSFPKVTTEQMRVLVKDMPMKPSFAAISAQSAAIPKWLELRRAQSRRRLFSLFR